MNKKYKNLKSRQQALDQEMYALIVNAIKEHGGKISFTPDDGRDLCELDNSEFIVSTLYGKHDNPNIGITDVYLDENNQIYVDGIDRTSDIFECGFQIFSEQYGDVLDFIAFIKGWNKSGNETTEEQDTKKELYAFLYPIERMVRNVPDEEIILDWENEMEEPFVERLTPHEFAELINDESFSELDNWVRFIEM